MPPKKTKTQLGPQDIKVVTYDAPPVPPVPPPEPPPHPGVKLPSGNYLIRF